MKLLFDENLSADLCARLADLFPDSSQVRLMGLGTGKRPRDLGECQRGGFAIVSLDADFADMAALFGSPPRSSGCGAAISRAL
jgi:predicted nuclease of predicted toxin-antitoxin system